MSMCYRKKRYRNIMMNIVMMMAMIIMITE